MNIYVVGYWSCEESEYTHLVCDTKYSEAELKRLVEECAIEALKIRKEKEEFGYDTIHDNVIELLKTKHGFREIPVEARWTVFGWGSLFTNDWKEYSDRDENLRSLRAKVRDEGYSKKDDFYKEMEYGEKLE